MSVNTRSTLRAIDTPHEGRPRRYLLRRSVVAGVVLALIWFVLAISNRLFLAGGIGWIVYLLHDALYVPLKGWVWTLWFPYVLVWLIPLAVAAALLATEYLSTAGPVRVLHRKVILSLGMKPWFQRVLAPDLGTGPIDPAAWSSSLTRGDFSTVRRFGFARRVIRKEQDAFWMQIAVDMTDGGAPDPHQIARLLRLTDMRLRLDPSDALAHLRALEIIAFAPKTQALLSLAKDMERFWSAQEDTQDVQPLLSCLAILNSIDAGAKLTASAQLHSLTKGFTLTTQTPVQDAGRQALNFVCDALAVLALGAAHRLPDGRGFQRLWVAARLSQSPAGVAQALGQAETLIFFEMWSQRAEAAQMRGKPDHLIQRALASTKSHGLQRIEAAETFAWKGAQP